jgi:Zn ribbon nucleic-acid-binding protein
MQPPKKEFRNKKQFDTSEDFFDRELGWVKRISERCPKCKSENTMALLEEQGFKGCTSCLYVELLGGFVFVDGGYSDARKILETLFDQKRVNKPIQYRFMPMFFKRN